MVYNRSTEYVQPKMLKTRFHTSKFGVLCIGGTLIVNLRSSTNKNRLFLKLLIPSRIWKTEDVVILVNHKTIEKWRFTLWLCHSYWNMAQSKA